MSSNSDTTETANEPTAPPDLFDRLGIDTPEEVSEDTHGFTVDVEWQDVETPSNVPEGEKEAEINLAERILRFALTHTDYGHHRSVSEGLTTFANNHRENDDTPEYWRKRAYQLSPQELNGCSLTAQEDRDGADVPGEGPTASMYEKARVIIAWAGEAFGPETVRELEQELAQEQAEEWIEAMEETREDREAATFLTTLPGELNGWHALPTLENAIAYAGPPTTQSGDIDESADADGEFIVLFYGDGYHRLFTYDFSDYHLFNPGTVDELDTHSIKGERRRRVGNPETWLKGVQMLLDHIDAAPGPAEPNPVPEPADTPRAKINHERPTSAIEAAIDAFDDLTPPGGPDDTDPEQAGLGDF
jgi:hypothetical protein